MLAPVRKHRIAMALVRQFSNPKGPAGTLAGLVMAHRSSNVRRNRWAVDLLNVRPTDRVLEIGFGPGVAIGELSRRIGPAGHVYGIDLSEVMLRQATRRNAAAIRAGRVTLRRASVENLAAAAPGLFDVILAVNNLAFWPDPVERLRELRQRLVPSGRMAVISQPRHPGATRDPVLAGREKAGLITRAGFTVERMETLLDLNPPAVCVIAVNAMSAERTGPVSG
jgi:ubiquinone/menaquinone biosynthesis C-methylase UbiE